VRILLAEDDVSQAESIKTWLEMDGYSVDWVERGDHAILAIEQHQYDCVLLDRGLPHATGDDILLKVRGKNLSTPVIFLTARDSIRDRVEGLDLGANDYLVKPFSLEELSARNLRRMAKCINNHCTHQTKNNTPLKTRMLCQKAWKRSDIDWLS
jgi:two-component system, OmpR family, response regulator